MILPTPDEKKTYRYAIIGSGPAGTTLALALAAKYGQERVLVIESGLAIPDITSRELSRVTASGDHEAGYWMGHSQRILGGTSMVWAGFCSVLEKRAFEAGSWPIAYSEIERFYPESCDILEVPKETYLMPEQPIRGTQSVKYRPFFINSPPVRFGQKYKTFYETSPNVDLLLGHSVLAIDHAAGRASGLNVLDREGKRSTVQADQYIVAAGGIGNARLLLLSGLNTNDQAGRYFMEHPHIFSFGKILADEKMVEKMHSLGGNLVHSFSLSDQYCLDNELLSFNALVGLGKPTPEKAPVLMDVTIMAEMDAFEDNRITLSESEKDPNQQAIPHVHLEYRYREHMKTLWAHFSDIVVRSNLGKITSYTDQYTVTGGGHLMGSTIMGSNPETSTVDRNSRLHELNNVYVAGSSVFPMGGGVNPTLSIVALSLRLAEHLAKQG